jgi:excisionase family DNA binding protein
MSEKRPPSSVAATAVRLGVCIATVYNLISDGKLVSFKIRRRRLVSDESIEALLSELDRPTGFTGQPPAAA